MTDKLQKLQPITDLFTKLISESIKEGFSDAYIIHCMDIIEDYYSYLDDISYINSTNYEVLLLNAIKSLNVKDFCIALAFSYVTQELEPEDTLLFIVEFCTTLINNSDLQNIEHSLENLRLKKLMEFNLNDMIPDYQPQFDNFIAYKIVYDKLKIDGCIKKKLEILHKVFPNIYSQRKRKYETEEPIRKSIRNRRKPDKLTF
jgi:hypothetical protein